MSRRVKYKSILIEEKNMDSEHTPKKAHTVGELKGKIAHVGAVLTASFNVDGRLFFTGGEDRVIRFWDSRNGSPVAHFDGHEGEVRDVCVTRDDTKMSSCGGDGQILYWDLSTQRTVRKFGGHNDGVNAVKFNEFASVIVSADSSVHIWDSRSHSIEPIQTFNTFKESVTSIGLRRTEMIAASVDGSVQKFDFRTNKRLSYNVGPPVKCMYMASTHDEFALTSGLDSTLKLLAMETSSVRTIQRYRGHTCESHKVGCCFTNEETCVVGGSEDGNIFIWDVLRSRPFEQFRAHSSVVTSVDYHPKEDCLVSASADGTVALWKK
ncbi:transducin/WD40 repeat-like superfamily protein [Artemisia annua]|uniref:Transducin/WD40 repeat-like superfamily protein n=1 Tax=Artemisia annua TaxID=35608 RepID=A0A2U1QA91_ARTAN|nr:transducin/WD40 repeat-like superfamily protein [Artemisia annua]